MLLEETFRRRGCVLDALEGTRDARRMIGLEQDTAISGTGSTQEPVSLRKKLDTGPLVVGAQIRNRINSGRGFFPQGTSTMPGHGPTQETAQLRRQ